MEEKLEVKKNKYWNNWKEHTQYGEKQKTETKTELSSELQVFLGKNVEQLGGVHAKSLQSCPALWDPMDCSPPGSSVNGILQARTVDWVAMPSYRRSSQLRDQTHVSCDSCIAGEFFTFELLGKPTIRRKS